MRLQVSAILISLAAAACTTTQADVEKTERKADADTAAAYDKADEKSFKAQNEADVASQRAVDDAETKIEKAQDKAVKTSDAAYTSAEKTAVKDDKKVATVRQKQFVDAMTQKLHQRHSAIRTLEATIKKSSDDEKIKVEPTLAQLKKAEHDAAGELTRAKKASWNEWEGHRAAVEDAFAKLDRHYRAAKESM